MFPKLIVGLGNPGDTYTGTRHNAGFMVVDRVLSRMGGRVVREERFNCVLCRAAYGGRRFFTAQPTTFMNRSGDAVSRIANVRELTPAEILVVYDCLDLPLGRLRLRAGGGSGGQKGVESIIHALGRSDFPRLRVGIGSTEKYNVVDHVLSAWTAEEQPLVERVLDAAADAVLFSLRRGVTAAMNAFNGWEPQPAAESETVVT
ncbi:MAG: aminoacyl-tRNA hydrolase [Lentisphaeria bacterium]|nr:aminoacyl-tRNA hydrolase [Lentisphaeria bacterium]